MEVQASKEQDELQAVAKLLIYLSRSGTFKSAPPETLTEKQICTEVSSASPTTPLSWSNRSVSSGGFCEESWTESSASPKRRRRSSLLLAPFPDPSSEPNQENLMATAAAEAVRTPSKAFGLRSNCASSLRDKRQAKKMTVMELRNMKDSLLLEQLTLRNELAKQEEIYGVLLEENLSLRKLESSISQQRKVNVFPFDLNHLPEED